MLTPEIQSEILALYFGEKRSIRSIAEKFLITRDSVRRVVKRRSVQLGIQSGKKPSILDPFKDQILELLKKDPQINSSTLLSRIRDQGYLGGQTVVRAWVKTKRPFPHRPREGFLRLEFQPGEAAQVDWGEFGDVFSDGVKIHCFAMVLCHSRYIYIEFTRSERFEDFIRCHENAFRFFGGAPKECWYDNLTTAVTDRAGSLVRFNARFMAYMGHHGIRPHACNPARGNEKGRVEGLIKYIRNHFFSGKEFENFDRLNQDAIVWRNQFANQREHRSTHKIPRLHFEKHEKQFLLALNPNKYDTDEVISRVVPPDFHIIYETNRYSVPWTLVSMPITLRVNAGAIKIYYHERHIITHPRSYKKNQVFTFEKHRAGLLERKPGTSRETWQLSAVKSIGPKMIEYIDLLRSGQKSLRSEMAKILALTTVYGEAAVHQVCGDLLDSGIVGVAELELLLKRSHRQTQSQLKPEPINFQNQKLNRVVPVVDLRRYDALLFESVNQKKAASESEVPHDNNEPNGSDSENS